MMFDAKPNILMGKEGSKRATPHRIFGLVRPLTPFDAR